jgi:hypothetical protein
MSSGKSVETNPVVNVSSDSPGSVDFINASLAKFDRNAPLTIDVLASLMQAQSEFFVRLFDSKLKERDEVIAKQREALDELHEQNANLRSELDDLQQYSRRNSIRIAGIPEPDHETPEDVQNSIKSLLNDDMAAAIEDRDICRMHRVGVGKYAGNGQPRQIILKFTSYSARRRVMKRRKELKTLRNKPHRIYINEDLTRNRAALAKAAREAKKKGSINDTWVFDGKIFIKKKDNEVIPVNSPQKLVDIINGLI